MRLSVKEGVLMIIALISIGISIAGFFVWQTTATASITNATKPYAFNMVDVNSSILGKAYPVITAENQRIQLNAEYDPMTWVQANDAIDGNLTSQVAVYGEINNHIKGDYEIRYVVRNSYGLKTTKRIRVIVD